MERGGMAGPTDGRRSSGGYKRVIGPRSLDCPETLLSRLAIDAGLGIRHASLHSPCALWRSMLGIRRCARRSGEAVPRGVRNALLMRAGFLAGTRGRLAPRLHGAGPIRLRPHLGWMIHVRGRAPGGRGARDVPFLSLSRAGPLGPWSDSLEGGAAPIPWNTGLRW